jgi:hypothetical protein
MSGPEVGGGASPTPAALAALRADPRRRAVALAAALVVGLALAWVHWLGLVVAGALVGVASRSLPRAVLWGLVVGVLALAVTVVGHPMGVGEFLSLRPPVYVALAAGLVAPVWGSLVRGVV